MTSAELELSKVEQSRLAVEEEAIKRAAADVGRALRVIRDERLYRAEYRTFEDYCLQRWGFNRRYADRQIEAAAVTDVVSPIGLTQLPESQARELAPLLDQPEQLRETYQRAAEATNGKPTAAAIRQFREAMATPPQEYRTAPPIWNAEESALKDQMEAGRTVVVSQRGPHQNLINWADQRGLYVRIDRRTEWGNPFEIPDDGGRDAVIRNYAEHYLPHKPSLLKRLESLRGKALGCWCAPEPCHGDVLKERAEE